MVAAKSAGRDGMPPDALKPAHRGYAYQDLLCAIRLVDILVGRARSIRVEEKQVPDDPFDDWTTTWSTGDRERVQIKHRDRHGTALPLSTFTTDDRSCRIDRLIVGAVRDRDGSVPRESGLLFRLVLRDAQPLDHGLATALVPAMPDPGPLFAGASTRRFRFDAMTLWPEPGARTPQETVRGDPWRFLRDAGLAREDVVWFCKRFVVETDAPIASLRLTEPLLAERILLDRLSEEVGVGVYPNSHRTSIDVAEALVAAARRARAGVLIPTQGELLHETRLRTDLGAVARAHPVVGATEVRRERIVESLVLAASEAATSGRPLLLVGAPGQGKTWICEPLVESLKEQGWLVAEHYCYLGQVDAERDARVSAQVVFASLLARLVEADRSLGHARTPAFAADESALLQVLECATARTSGQRVALVVDGLDHVTRVAGATSTNADPSTALARELAALDLPRGCVLVVASQRGPHLAPLRARHGRVVVLERWGRGEIDGLAAAHGVLRALREAAPGEGGASARDGAAEDTLLSALAQRSGGNPLYATYLCRELLRGALFPADAVQVLHALPPYDGTLEVYYRHLLSEAGPHRSIAGVLGLLDFSVTREELREIVPIHVRPYIDAAVARLGPALVERSAQGGLRVYHESFARYLARTLDEDPEAKLAWLSSLVAWLTARGFFEDARAYRFLLPLRARAAQAREVCAAIDVDFVARSVAAAFSAPAIIRNLAVAAAAARELEDWDTLVRCLELARAASTYDFWNEEDVALEFADVWLELLGSPVVVGRLLDDGHPTFNSAVGLRLCAALDRAGTPPPWREYLEVFERDQERSDVGREAEPEAAVSLAWLRGTLREGRDAEREDDLRRGVDAPTLVAAWVTDRNLRGAELANTLVDTVGLAETARIAGALPLAAGGELALALLERLAALHSTDDALVVASLTDLLRLSHDAGVLPGTLPRIVALDGMSSDLLRGYNREHLVDLTARVQDSGIVFSPTVLLAWLDELERAAHCDRAGLDAVEVAVSGSGWYRCWLRFVVRVVSASVATEIASAPTASVAIFRTLTQELDPFAGEPRACDLHPLREPIVASLRRGLTLVKDGEWGAIIDVLKQVCERTSTTVRGELGGPLPEDALLQLVVDFTTPERVAATTVFVDSFVAERGSARWYCDVARFELIAARLALRSGDRDGAHARHQRATRLLVAYGRRRDLTIYELLRPVPTLVAADPVRGRQCLARLQPLCRRVLEHTDGKDTFQVLSDWWEELGRADGEAAGWLILQGQMRWPNERQRRLDGARRELWRAYSRSTDPVVAAALRLTIDSPLEEADAELVRRLGSAPGGLSARLCDSVIARVDEYPGGVRSARNEDLWRIQDLNAAATSVGAMVCAGLDRGGSDGPNTDQGSGGRADRGEVLRDLVLVEYGDSLPGLIRGVRERLRRPLRDERGRWDGTRLANAVGYRLLKLREGDARSVLALVASGPWEAVGELLIELAEGLARHGAVNLAVYAYLHAYLQSDSGRRWFVFGRGRDVEFLQRAMALDRAALVQCLASEAERWVRGPWGGATATLVHAFGVLGVVQDGIRADPPFDGRDLKAFRLWDSAFDVIATRLPRMGARDDPDLPYESEPTEEQGVDRAPRSLEVALAAATVGALAQPVLEAKRRAFLAVALLIRLRPQIVAPAINAALEGRLDVPTLTWLLEVLATMHQPPVLVAEPLLRRLAGRGELVIRAVARRLLAKNGFTVDSPPSQPASTELARACQASARGRSHDPMGFAGGVAEELTARACALTDDAAGWRLASAEAMLPGLRQAVVWCVADALGSEALNDRMAEQLRSLGVVGTRVQLPDALLAIDEAVEEAIQETAGGGRAALAAIGELVADPVAWEDGLADRLLRDPLLALAVEGSRVPRPSISMPPGPGDPRWAGGIQDGRDIVLRPPVTPAAPATDVVVTAGGAWRVLGLVERWTPARPRPAATLRLAPDGATFADVLRTPRPEPEPVHASVIRYAAVEVRPPGDLNGLDALPVAQGGRDAWFRRLPQRPRLEGRASPLVGIDADVPTGAARERCSLGLGSPFLAPLPLLIATLSLLPTDDALSLEMRDTAGPALLYRCWRTQYTVTVGERELPQALLRGGALLLRQDLFELLLGKSGGALAWREHLVGSDVMPPARD